MRFDDHIRDALAELERGHLLRTPRERRGPQAPRVQVGGRSVLGFCSNDYLGLANDPRLLAAARDALERVGLGAGASRHISGTEALHREAEAALAGYVRRPAALLFSTGYAANLGAIQALMGPADVIFSDALNHASLIDGCRLARATVHVYRHGDLEHLERLLRAERAAHRSALIVTESLYSMDGDEVDLPSLRRLADAHDAGLMVDEAHALGVLGPRGRGLAAAAGIVPDLLVGTLGKAFGSAGAFVAGDGPLVRLVENRARSYVFSTAPPPALAAAAIAAAELVSAAEDRRAAVCAHATRIRAGARALGLPALPGRSPIIPIPTGSPERTMAISAALLERGVFVHGIRPPTVPRGGSRLRITPIATHAPADVEQLLDALRWVS